MSQRPKTRQVSRRKEQAAGLHEGVAGERGQRDTEADGRTLARSPSPWSGLLVRVSLSEQHPKPWKSEVEKTGMN